jgi:hypothetical protein
VMVKLAGTVPATKAVLLELGKEVGGRYLLMIMVYSYPWTREELLVGLPDAFRSIKVTMGS